MTKMGEFADRFVGRLERLHKEDDRGTLAHLRRGLGKPPGYRAFPDAGDGGPSRVLFRVDLPRDPGPPVVLVQSAVRPDWSPLQEAKEYLVTTPETKPFQPEFHVGQRLLFRLRANPTVKRDEKRHGLFREEDQIAWLNRKAESGGFAIRSVRIVSEGVHRGRKTEGGRRREMTFCSVLFDGVLEVTDPRQLQQTVAEGIGSGKGFGFGLLSLARADQWRT